MSNRLFFNAREWSFNKACDKNVGERCFVNGLDGKLVEIYSIGDWEWNWTEIMTKPLLLEKNTEYSFCFWLNGGENDRNDEVCQFRVVFDDDNENCLIYKLNRGFIKPLKRYKGWELYDITFTTGDNESTILKFVAKSAYMAVQPAKEPEYYANLEDVVDEFEELRPQRHNIIFADGWPANGWYSTKELQMRVNREKQNEKKSHFGPEIKPPFGKEFRANFDPVFGAKFGAELSNIFPFDQDTKVNSSNNRDNLGMNFSQAAEDIKKHVQENIMNQINMDDIIEKIMDDIDIDDIIDEIVDEIDVDDIIEDIKDQFDVPSLQEEIKRSIMSRIK